MDRRTFVVGGLATLAAQLAADALAAGAVRRIGMLSVVPVFIVVLAFNFFGDGLRDAADPYSASAR